MNKEYVLEKLAFIAVTPFNVTNKKELESKKGYLKEVGNRVAGSIGGSLTGATIAGLLGAAIAAGVIKIKPNTADFFNVKDIAALAALTAAPIGSIAGDYKSLRKTEREAGVDPSTFGKYLARGLGSATGTNIIADTATVAIPKIGIGGNIALKALLQPTLDYTISRKLQKYKEV